MLGSNWNDAHARSLPGQLPAQRGTRWLEGVVCHAPVVRMRLQATDTLYHTEMGERVLHTSGVCAPCVKSQTTASSRMACLLPLTVFDGH
jgi:hypothetical protein